jgi:hypothetical protein
MRNRFLGTTAVIVGLAYVAIKAMGKAQDFLAEEVDSDYIWWSKK